MTKITYSEEYKQQVLKRAEETSVKEAAAEFNIAPQLVFRWMNMSEPVDTDEEPVTEPTVENETTKTYTNEFKKQLLEHAEDVGIKKAAFEFSVPLEIVEQWAEEIKDTSPVDEKAETPVTEPAEEKKRGRTSKYSDELKTQVLKRIAEVGPKQAAKEFNIPAPTVQTWKRVAGISYKSVAAEPVEGKKKGRSKYSDEFKAEVVKRAEETSTAKAAAEYNVSVGSIRLWKMKAEEAEIPVDNVTTETEAPVEENEMDSTLEYSDEFISRVLKRAEEVGVRQAAKEHMIAWQKVARWKKRAKKTVDVVDAITEIPAKPKYHVEEVIDRATGRSLEIENAVLKSENEMLKEQVERLKKALQELM